MEWTEGVPERDDLIVETTTGHGGETLKLTQTIRIVDSCRTRGLEIGELVWISDDGRSVDVKFKDGKVEPFYHDCLDSRLW
jgi:hypothetical protein